MGHVDHGKTSLLDYIRKSNLTKKEFGNITQHIGIYNVKIKNKKNITFIDTPGHESFISIRRISIKISNIVLIIISSDKGIKNQTIESINHAKNENIPIIFVFTKIDKKNTNIDLIKKQLLNINISINKSKGEYLYQKVSIKNGYGIDNLIKKIFNISKKLNLKTNLNTLNCSGIIIDSFLDKKKGYIVKLLVKKGILKKGLYIMSGIYYGKIKNIFNDNNKNIDKVYPSYPCSIIGLNGSPFTGNKFETINNKKKIKKIIIKRKLLINKNKIVNNNNFFLYTKKKKKKNFIIKGDVDSSICVISDEINKFKNINIIKKSIGNITESDINLSNTFNSIIIGFNVKILVNKKKINNIKNKIYIFNVIYDLINFFKKKEYKLNKKKKKIIIGKSKVIKIFNKKNKKIFGCKVLNGKINKKYNIKILRNNKVIYKGEILSIKILNKNVLEVKKNNYFGIIIKNFDNLKINDIIESYKNKLI
ncbi:MAG: GTP-binding protein [Candidatus Shikimatogenerans bostrichidophilus]|nr:MAG: GTP-binding protein [Candidatus Shikimatogenerans bostrichidophilus]